jgi:ABC-type siderophore export system fused ATPase/permease subunit
METQSTEIIEEYISLKSSNCFLDFFLFKKVLKHKNQCSNTL